MVIRHTRICDAGWKMIFFEDSDPVFWSGFLVVEEAALADDSIMARKLSGRLH